MPLADIGIDSLVAFPIAGVGFETAATSVGAGIVLGGFIAGTVALLGRSRSDRDWIAEAGYLGGWLAVLALLVDMLWLSS